MSGNTTLEVEGVMIEVTERGRFMVPGEDVSYEQSWQAVGAAKELAKKRAKAAIRAKGRRRPRPTKPRIEQFNGLPLWSRVYVWGATDTLTRCRIVGITDTYRQGTRFQTERWQDGDHNRAAGWVSNEDVSPSRMFVATPELIEAITDAEDMVRTLGEAIDNMVDLSAVEVTVADEPFTVTPEVVSGAVRLSTTFDGQELTAWSADHLTIQVRDIIRARTHTQWRGLWLPNALVPQVEAMQNDLNRWELIARTLIAVAQPGTQWGPRFSRWFGENKDLLWSFRRTKEAYLEDYHAWQEGK